MNGYYHYKPSIAGNAIEALANLWANLQKQKMLNQQQQQQQQQQELAMGASLIRMFPQPEAKPLNPMEMAEKEALFGPYTETRLPSGQLKGHFGQEGIYGVGGLRGMQATLANQLGQSLMQNRLETQQASEENRAMTKAAADVKNRKDTLALATNLYDKAFSSPEGMKNMRGTDRALYIAGKSLQLYAASPMNKDLLEAYNRLLNEPQMAKNFVDAPEPLVRNFAAELLRVQNTPPEIGWFEKMKRWLTTLQQRTQK